MALPDLDLTDTCRVCTAAVPALDDDGTCGDRGCREVVADQQRIDATAHLHQRQDDD